MKGGDSQILAETQRRGKVERTNSNVHGIIDTLNNIKVDKIPMNISASFAAHIAVSNLFDFSKDGFLKRFIFGKLNNSTQRLICNKNEKRGVISFKKTAGRMGNYVPENQRS